MKKRDENLQISLRDVFFGAVDPRRRQEKKDSRMVPNGKNSIANLSNEPVHREFNQNTFVEHFRQNEFEITGD